MNLRDHLQDIYDRRGVLTPAVLVDEARATNHPLHAHFQWDDKAAGEAWRREQAHQMIRSVRVVYRPATDTDPAEDVRAWHAVRGEKGYVYEPAEKVANDPLIAGMVLRDMEREWKALHRRYGNFVEFAETVRRTLDENAA